MLYIQILALIQQSFLCYQVFDKLAESSFKVMSCLLLFVHVVYLAMTLYKGIPDNDFPAKMMSQTVLITIIINHTYFRRREMKEASESTKVV
jgi:hypothetical protein